MKKPGLSTALPYSPGRFRPRSLPPLAARGWKPNQVQCCTLAGYDLEKGFVVLKMKKPGLKTELFHLESGNDLLSRLVSKQVPSALKGLTSVFGMGTGGSLSPSSPEFSQGFVLPPSSRGLRTHRAFFFSRVPSKPHIQIFSILSNLLFCPLVSFSLSCLWIKSSTD